MEEYGLREISRQEIVGKGYIRCRVAEGDMEESTGGRLSRKRTNE